MGNDLDLGQPIMYLAYSHCLGIQDTSPAGEDRTRNGPMMSRMPFSKVCEDESSTESTDRK